MESKRFKALIIGCGNIGAQYDLDSSSVITHAKALSLNKSFEFNVYDIDKNLSSKIADHYGVESINSLKELNLEDYDMISLCTPTQTHYKYLCLLLKSKVPLIICEKPVTLDLLELNNLCDYYKNGSSKIIVNFPRRFQNNFFKLNDFLQSETRVEDLLNVSIKYQKGFVNNCIHALDLVEYLTGEAIDLENIKLHNQVIDYQPKDPTFSLQANWKNINFNVLGLSNVQYGLLDISLYYKTISVEITDAGNTINVYKRASTSIPFPLLELQFSYINSNKDFMVGVIEKAAEVLNNHELKDNFMESINLNKKILKYLS